MTDHQRQRVLDNFAEALSRYERAMKAVLIMAAIVLFLFIAALLVAVVQS